MNHLLARVVVSATPVIETGELTKDYGSGRGLFGLVLEVDQGEVFGFLGPNGAGHDPLTRGVDLGGLIVLGAVTAVLSAAAAIGIGRRDLRG
jgi:ABC-type lipopolysaccharide export system ATPase subunit